MSLPLSCGLARRRREAWTTGPHQDFWMSKFPGWSRFPGLMLQVHSALQTALSLETFFSLDFVTLGLRCFSQTEACRPWSQRCAPACLCCRPDVECRWMWWLPEREAEPDNSAVTVSVCDGPRTHSCLSTSLWPTSPSCSSRRYVPAPLLSHFLSISLPTPD